MNVKFKLKVTKATRCFITCADQCGLGSFGAKVEGTELVNGAEVPTVWLEESQSDCDVIYEGNTPNLPHLVTVGFAKYLALDAGAYWITFDLVLTYTYEPPPAPTSLMINSKTLDEKTVTKIAYLTSPTGYRDEITLPFGPKGLTPYGTWLVEIVSPDFIKWENEDTNKQRSLELTGTPVTVTAYFVSGEPPVPPPPSNILPIIAGVILIGGVAYYYLMKG